MSDEKFDPGPNASPAMILAAKLMEGMAPACNEWLAVVIEDQEPSIEVLDAFVIALCTELSMVVKMVTQNKPGNRLKVAEGVIATMRHRLLHLLKADDDIPPTSEGPDARYN